MNNNKIKLMFAYHRFLQEGQYIVANKILELLCKRKIYLGLDNNSWEIEKLAYKFKLRITYSLDILPMPKGRGFLDTNDTCLLK